MISDYLRTDQNIEAIQSTEGPSIINAGPGSGKTRFLCNKVAYLLMEKSVDPEGIIVCTFTEKAASELKNRIKSTLSSEAPDLLNTIDITKLRIGTIHSVLKTLIEENITYTRYKSEIRVLDTIERKFFIHNHINSFGFKTYSIPSSKLPNVQKIFFDLNEIDGVFFEPVDEWLLTDFLCEFFDNLVEQGAEIMGLKQIQKIKGLDILIKAYCKYKDLLQQYNYLDFSQIQNIYWSMLNNSDFRCEIRRKIKYILVDEYQDTNYIQERLLLETLGSVKEKDEDITNLEHSEKYKSKNITVVGDINQSLYRFRGAEIDNILTFKTKFSVPVKEFKIFQNFRSTKNIIDVCNNVIGNNLEYYKGRIGLEPDNFIITPGKNKENYPVVRFDSNNGKTEAFVNKIKVFLYQMLDKSIFKHKRDIAILLPSIRFSEAQSFKECFGDDLQIPMTYDFFNNALIIDLLRALAQIFKVSKIESLLSTDFNDYFENTLKKTKILSNDSANALFEKFRDNSLSVIELLYEILALTEFNRYNNDNYYKYFGSLTSICNKFSELYTANDPYSFFNILLPYIFTNSDEIFTDEVEMSEDKIQLMTIHQSKGLQFPIVVVGYNKTVRNVTEAPRYADTRSLIRDIYGKESVEDDSYVETLELNRLFYVAFSRAKDLLIVGTRLKNKFNQIEKGKFKVKTCTYDDYDSVLSSFSYEPEDIEVEKPTFSYTRDIQTYNLCPQLYAFINEHGLVVPAKTDFAFGKLVHQTIERINKLIYKSKTSIDENSIFEVAKIEFENVFRSMVSSEKLLDQKTDALSQVFNYIYNFKELLFPNQLHSIEEPVSLETKDYFLTGKIDAVFRIKDKFLIVDFKSGKKSTKTKEDIESFETQIKLYAFFYKQKYSEPIDLLIYSTGESAYEDGNYPVDTKNVQDAADKANETLLRIIQKDFTIPSDKDLKKVCPNCPFVSFCHYKI